MATRTDQSPVTLRTYFRDVLRRLPALVGVWLAFGGVLGVALSPAHGPIGIAAGIVAGLIVYSPVGVLLALVGAKWDESLFGGVFGLLAAAAVVFVGQRTDAAYIAAFGVTFGGLLGGTFLTVAYRLPRLVVGRVRRAWAVPSPARVEQPVAV